MMKQQNLPLFDASGKVMDRERGRGRALWRDQPALVVELAARDDGVEATLDGPVEHRVATQAEQDQQPL